MSANRSVNCEYDTSPMTGVCGECGMPLCSECANDTKDPKFRSFDRTGFNSLLIGFVLLLGVPVFLWVLFPDMVPNMTRSVFGEPIFIMDGLILSSIFVGAAIIGTTWWRKSSGKKVLKSKKPVRILCEDCYFDAKTRKRMSSLIKYISIIVVIYGLYTSFTSGGQHPSADQMLVPLMMSQFWIVGAGLALYIFRNDLAIFISGLID